MKYKHDCDFAYDLDIVAKYSPGTGISDRIKRYFMRLKVISELNKIGNAWLRSQGAVANEKERHLIKYRYMIHPFSDICRYWQMFMILILSAQFIMIPIDIAYFRAEVKNLRLGTGWKACRFFFDICCCTDVVLCFITGYYDETTKTVVLKPSAIAM